VTSFSNPKEGLEAATARDFDVIISDIGMPEISGFDLMSRLRAWEDQHHRSHQPSIALTAYATHEDAEHALASGFQLHVPKPVNFATLSEAIRTLIKGHDLA
jgi:CheY-like chemotaxis protein